MTLDERIRENLEAASAAVPSAAPANSGTVHRRGSRRRRSRRIGWVTGVGLAAVGAIFLIASGSASSDTYDVAGFDCPITLPTDPGFIPPEGYPEAPGSGLAWFGSDELWTSLPIDGTYDRRKSVWWSINFPGGDVEEEPFIEVIYDRLDTSSEPIRMGGPGTNAYSAGEGWFMIAGIDPSDAGCWEVTGSYKGSSLRYVYELR